MSPPAFVVRTIAWFAAPFANGAKAAAAYAWILIASLFVGIRGVIERRQHREEATIRKTSSALSPLLWLCGLVVPVSIFGAIETESPSLRWVLVCLALACVCAVLFAYFYFLRRDPDRLHSDHHRFQMRALDVIAEKGGRFEELPYTVEMTSNPEPLTEKKALAPKASRDDE